MISADIHEALALHGLVTETVPLSACSTDYRTKFREALQRAFGGEPEDIQSLSRQVVELEERILGEENLQETIDELRQQLSTHEKKSA